MLPSFFGSVGIEELNEVNMCMLSRLRSHNNTRPSNRTRYPQTPRAGSAKVRLGRSVVVRVLPLSVVLHLRVCQPVLPLVVDQVGVWVFRSPFVRRVSLEFPTTPTTEKYVEE